ncbi:MAG: hypothetical protein V1911_02380 [Candidatus Micrarchaeota archaeon]
MAREFNRRHRDLARKDRREKSIEVDKKNIEDRIKKRRELEKAARMGIFKKTGAEKRGAEAKRKNGRAGGGKNLMQDARKNREKCGAEIKKSVREKRIKQIEALELLFNRPMNKEEILAHNPEFLTMLDELAEIGNVAKRVGLDENTTYFLFPRQRRAAARWKGVYEVK